MAYELNQIIFMTMDELVPKDHFLRRLADEFPWECWAEPFKKCFKGEKEYGPLGYTVATLLKMTVLSFLYNLSDRQTENYVRDTNSARYFVGLNLKEDVPDATTLCRFRSRIVECKKEYLLKALFNRVIREAKALGIKFGKIQLLDSTHVESAINVEKEERENRNLKEKGEDLKPPKDPDATWGCKGTFKRRDLLSGEIKEEKKYFYGYKIHTSLNSKTSLFTSFLVSTGKDADIKAARFLLDDDMSKGIDVSLVAADRAYDDGDLHMYCGKHEIFPAIALKSTRTEHKSKKLNEFWNRLKEQPFYKKGLKLRYKIEQKFGEAKMRHGLGKARYRGIYKFAFQACFTLLAMNLKRIMKLLGFKVTRGPCFCGV